MNYNIYNLMNWPDIEDLVYSECSNPHKLLGAQMCKEGMLVQVFRPDAVEVFINIAGRKKNYPCEKVDEAGYFAVVIPVKKLTAYTVTVEDVKGHKEQYIDPYACDTGLTQEQLKKLSVGDDEKAYQHFGAHEMTVNGISGVNFAVWAPNAVRVSVIGEFNHWDGRILQMKKHEESGIFELFVPEMKTGVQYKYEIKFKDGNLAVKTDPYCLCCESKQGFASVVYTPKSFVWEDQQWKNHANGPMAICEINPEEYQNGKDLEELAALMKEEGYTHIELTAAAEYGGKGYNPCETVAYFAPSGIFGTPEDFKKLVNTFHKHHLGVIIDWNAAFMSNAATGLTWFDGKGIYETSTVRFYQRPELKVSTFNLNMPQVRGFLISNAMMWVKEYHVDGLRIDELASLLYLDYGRGPGEWIPNLYGGNENLDAAAFFRTLKKKVPALLIAEDSSAWPRVTGEEEDSLRFDLKCNNSWRKDFMEFMEQDPLFRKGVYQKLTDSMLYHYSENFLLEFSHKEFEQGGSILDRMPGIQGWEKEANVRLAFGYLYLYPGKKLVNFNQIQSVKEQYRKALNEFYIKHRAAYELDDMPQGFEWIDTCDKEETVLAFMRNADDSKKEKEQLLVVVNFTPVVREDFLMGVKLAGKYTEIFNSDHTEYGGQGYGNNNVIRSERLPKNGWEDSIRLTLPPLSVTVYAYEPYTDLELEEIQIKQEAVKAKQAAEQEALKAEQLKERAEEEARAALEAEKKAKQAAQAALEAKLIAEKQALEAEQAKLKIEEETQKKLAALKKRR